MQHHLRYHGLSEEEVERLAGNIFIITQRLRMAQRILYYRRGGDGGQVGAGPQTLLDGTPLPALPGYDKPSYDCLGA